MSKVIYLGTTENCFACETQKNILEVVKQKRPDINIIICDYTELQKYFQINIKLTDFPVTIITEDDVIKRHFVGTKTVNKIIELFNQLNY